MQKWYFIDSGKCSPSFNMALDEALLKWHSEGKMPPIIRFYEWQPATLSIGYFQQSKRDIDFNALNAQGISFVRRPTGGRAVLHEHELTYSIIVDEHYPNIPESVTEAYRMLSEGLLIGFQNLGLDAYFSIPKTKQQQISLKQPKSAVCFDAPSWYELVVEGKKVAGSAQTRQHGVILQHGAILLSLNIEKLLSVFNFKSPEAREKMRTELPYRAVAIDTLTNQVLSIDACKRAFKTGFEQALHIELIPYKLTDEQLQLVAQIEREKYANDAWNFKK